MAFKKLTAAIAALALTASPVVAQSAAAPAPATESVEDESSLAGTNRPLGIAVGAAIIAVIIYILIQASDDDEDDDDDGGEVPVSP